MAMSGGSDDGAPMMEMNMTPLIDVLLVLLIMFIITIPVATHSVDIDLPQPNPNPPPVTVEPDKNKLVITQMDELLSAVGMETVAAMVNGVRELGLETCATSSARNHSAAASRSRAIPEPRCSWSASPSSIRSSG